jgi:hypothetical protein
MTVIVTTPIFHQEVPEQGAAKGHVRFTLNSLKPEDFALAGFCATVASTVLYERLQAGGTSFIIDFTKEIARIDVLARYQDDGLDFQWPLNPADGAELDAIQERIRAKTFLISSEKSTVSNAERGAEKGAEKTSDATVKTNVSSAVSAEKTAIPVVDSSSDASSERSEEEEDYLTKQLHRIP